MRLLHALRAVGLSLLACSASACSDDSPPPPPAGPSDVRPSNTTCLAPARPSRVVTLEHAFPALSFDTPIQMKLSPGGDTWYVVEMAGRVWRFSANDGTTEKELALDISDRVRSDGAYGLLGIALHPRFEDTGDVFLSYTAHGGTYMRALLTRIHSNDGGASFDAASETVLMEYDLSERIHTNDDVHFGPDGYLYWSTGDGGPHGDPDGHAQNESSLRGKVLRIDVDGGAPYAIPPDNPFADGGGAPEVWAYGLRNPWRFSFDRATGELWLGDVGWRTREEINRIEAGNNYGWPIFEGTLCRDESACNRTPTVLPVADHGREQMRSISAGFVYRGAAIPALAGHMIYADFVYGFILALDTSDAASEPLLINDDGRPIPSFAEEHDGELLALDLVEGTIWRLVAGAASDGAQDDVPPTLAETGCFGPGGQPRPGLIPYEIQAPFWSDGATKRRWLALPDDTTIDIARDGDLELPIGSVLAKEFTRDDLRVETRLFVRHDDGAWAGYSYRWDETQTDATLIPASAGLTLVPWGEGDWYYPRRNECSFCHSAAAGRSLGLEIAQLDRRVTLVDDREVDQLPYFEALGLFTTDLPVDVTPLPDPFGAEPLDERARAWLHTNCAMCHRPGGGGQGDIDMRFTTPLANTNLCGVAPELGDLDIADALRIAPGEPERSVLLARIRTTSTPRMPPIPRTVVDDDGAALIADWIASLPDCSD